MAAVMANLKSSAARPDKFKLFSHDTFRPSASAGQDQDTRKMDNLRFSHTGRPVKYCVEFLREHVERGDPDDGSLYFNVTCVEKNGDGAPVSRDRTPLSNVKVATNLKSVNDKQRAQRVIHDILKDAAAGGVSKPVMKKKLKNLSFDVGIIDDCTIDSLIDELKKYMRDDDITPHPKPAYHERSVDGLYKMALFTTRLLFLETGSLSKFSSFKVFEKGVWRACNAFHVNGGEWDGVNSLLHIIANGFALHFQTSATIMDPASPCQSSLVSSMRRVEGESWFKCMYGLNKANPQLKMSLIQDWCTAPEINHLQIVENRESMGHFVPTDATQVTLNIQCKSTKYDITSTTTGFVYSTVPETCIEKWTLTPRQRFTGFDGILLGNTENGNIFNGDDLRLILQCIIGKENGDCDQIYAILYYAIQLAAHRYYNNTARLTWEACFTEVMKEIMVVTCDRVVYYTCMCLKISCTYTGSGDGVVYVYEPYKNTRSVEEERAISIELSKKKIESEVENLMKILSSQTKHLSTAVASFFSSVRYKNPEEPAIQYESFPNNCYNEFKDLVLVKKDRLAIVYQCVSNIKNAINEPQVTVSVICNLLVNFVLAIIITNLAVVNSNVQQVISIFIANFNFSVQGFESLLQKALNNQDVKDILESPVSTKYPVDYPSDEYFQDIASDININTSMLLGKLNDVNLYIIFLTKLNNSILKDKNNTCVSTTQELSIYRPGNLTVYILNSAAIPITVFNRWKSTEISQRTRRRSTEGQEHGGGGNIRKKIIQRGGANVPMLIEKAHGVNLNDEKQREDFILYFREDTSKEEEEEDGDLENIMRTQSDPRILRHYLTRLSEFRIKRIQTIDNDIIKLTPAASSPSPDLNAQHNPADAGELAREKENQLVSLLLELNDQHARMHKENYMNQILQNDIPEQDKEYYWKTRNEIIQLIKDPKNFSIIEKTVLEMTDIEMLVCVWEAIYTIYQQRGGFKAVHAFLKNICDELSHDSPQPITWLNVPNLNEINIWYTDTRTRFYPPAPAPAPAPAVAPPNQHAVAITKYLLYGEEIGNPESIIPDSERILLLFMLHVLLNEVIRDMIPDSFGKDLQLPEHIIELLEQTYTISSSIDPSNHTQGQIEAARTAAKSMSVPRFHGHNGNDDGNDGNDDGSDGGGDGGGDGGKFNCSIPSPSPPSSCQRDTSFMVHSPSSSSSSSSSSPQPPPARWTSSKMLLVKALKASAEEEDRRAAAQPPAAAASVWVGPRLRELKKNAAVKRPRPAGFDGGSSTRTRRRRNLSRHTQYTNKKNKRSSKSTKHNTIKHRKSYRKHNRTIKRRSYRK